MGKGSGTIKDNGYKAISKNGTLKYEHVLVAERALGQSLPGGAEVHHIDGDKQNNKPSNLIVCNDRAYHMLIHTRTRALDSCGNADYRKCFICGRYDDPEIMLEYPTSDNSWRYRHKIKSGKCNRETT